MSVANHPAAAFKQPRRMRQTQPHLDLGIDEPIFFVGLQNHSGDVVADNVPFGVAAADH